MEIGIAEGAMNGKSVGAPATGVGREVTAALDDGVCCDEIAVGNSVGGVKVGVTKPVGGTIDGIDGCCVGGSTVRGALGLRDSATDGT